MSDDSRAQTDDGDSCSFCGKAGDQVERLIAGPPGVFICNECVDVCSSLLSTDEPAIKKKTPRERSELPTPFEIKEHLDQYIIGQDRAKRTISVAVYNHYKRLFRSPDDTEVELEKSNILLIGPTGCGKTAIARALAQLLDVPFAIGDATTITEAGYVGEDVENLLLRLIQSADGEIDLAETGILYIDEIDKISRSSGNVSITRDVSGEGVQQSLLKLIEGTVSNVPPAGGRKHPEQKYLQIDTSNILFVCGGAFAGIEEIVKRRLGAGVVGFELAESNNDDQNVGSGTENREDTSWLFAQVRPEDLIEFGLIPEFIGRLPVLTTLDELSEEALVSILTEPKNALVKQYTALFEMDNATLEFTEDALGAIAKIAQERRTGARALRSILEERMLDIMFDLPQGRSQRRRYTITKDVIENKAKPVIHIEGPVLQNDNAEDEISTGESSEHKRA